MNSDYNTAGISLRDSFASSIAYTGCQSYPHEILSKAKVLALKAHAGIYYQPENIPYSTHLYKVVNCIHSVYDGYFDLNFASSLGWLHDVVEDTAISPQD